MYFIKCIPAINPNLKEAEVVESFRELAYAMPIILNFRWMDWEEGTKIYQDDSFDMDSIDIPTKCKLITAIIRQDRFCAGALASAFESGLVLRLLKSIQKEVG